MIIYKATNKIDGKCYIGQTIKGLKRRKQEHSNAKDGCYFHNAIHKYGFDNFEWEVIEECDSKEELDEMEFHYIKQYDSFKPNGYNLTLGGNKGTYGWIPSEETKNNIRKSLKSSWKDPNSTFNSKEYREKLKGCNAGEKSFWYGKSRPEIIGENNPAKKPEARKKISESKKGKKRPDLTERNKNNANKSYEEIYGVEKAKEIKEKMSKSRKGKKLKPMSEEQKENLRKIKLKYYYELISPDNKKIIIDNMSKFCKENNLNKSSMLYLVKGKNKKGMHKGWKGKILREI